jgi:hypothetical protein
MAGDDLRYIIVAASIYRSIQLLLAISLLVHTTVTPDVRQNWLDHIEYCLETEYNNNSYPRGFENSYQIFVGYASFCVVVAMFGLVFLGCAYRISTLGTPTTIQPRQIASRLWVFDLTVIYVMRVGAFVWGLIVLQLLVKYCTCPADNTTVNNIPINVDDDLTTRYHRSMAFEGLVKEVCWMYTSGWTGVIVGIQVMHAVDWVFGIVFYFIFVWRAIPYNPIALLSVQTKWRYLFQCVLSCMACYEGQCCRWCWWFCFSSSSGEDRGTADLQDFAMMMSDAFHTHGAVDVTTTDFLAGIYVTRLLHVLVEYELRQHLSRTRSTPRALGVEHTDDALNTTTSVEVQNWKSGDNLVDFEQAMIRFIEGKFHNSSVHKDGDALGKVHDITDDVDDHAADEEQPAHQEQRPNKEQDTAMTATLTSGNEAVSNGISTPVPTNTNDNDNGNGGTTKTTTTDSLLMKNDPKNNSAIKLSAEIEGRRGANIRRRVHNSVLFAVPSGGTEGQNVGIHDKNTGQKLSIISRLSPRNVQEKMYIAEGARYIDFATNIYSWSVADRDATFHWGKLWNWCSSQRRKNRRDRLMHIQRSRSSLYTFGGGDHAGYTMEVAPIVGIKETDIVYASYKVGIVATPYAIIIDRKWKTVVVTVRGTLSVGDIVKDMMVTEIELTDYAEKYGFGDGEGKFAHRGMLNSTEWIYTDWYVFLPEELFVLL